MKPKLPTFKVQQNKRNITLTMLAFFPNRLGGKYNGYMVALNTKGVEKEHHKIKPDETETFLYVNEIALPM